MNKQIVEVAEAVIKSASDVSKSTVEELRLRRAAFFTRLEDENLSRQTEGKDALGNLRRLRGGKLAPGDEVLMAQRLYYEVNKLKTVLRDAGIGIGEFCIHAKLSDASESSKELHRLTLPPGKNPTEVRLRRTADKYHRLIEAISKTTNESSSTLADRVLIGTSLHPSGMKNLTETEMVQTALQRIVDKIDDEFAIHAKFMQIAELKTQLTGRTEAECWPLQPPLSPDELSEMYSSLSLKIPVTDSDVSDYWRSTEDMKDKRYAFWKRQLSQEPDLLDKKTGRISVQEETSLPAWPIVKDSGGLQDTEFFYIPHAPLGVVEFANLPRRQESEYEYQKAVQHALDHWRGGNEVFGKSWVELEYTATDNWDSEKECPSGQIVFSPEHHRGTEFAWLVMYPMPDGSRLMPMLYIAYQEGGPYLLPLDIRNLDIFRDAIWLNEKEHMPAFERIKELLGYRPGTCSVIEDGLRQTASWLDHNPIFKIRRQKSNDLEMLSAFCNQLWEKK